ncbi:MAG: hypothetical protein ACC655_07445 [Rhodothermia bacterium]
MNRFAARFRLAGSLASLSLDGYSTETVAGYRALFRLLLVWSAFELYLKIVNLRQADCETLFEKHGQIPTAIDIIESAPKEYFRFLHAHVNQPQKRGLTRYLGASVITPAACPPAGS